MGEQLEEKWIVGSRRALIDSMDLLEQGSVGTKRKLLCNERRCVVQLQRRRLRGSGTTQSIIPSLYNLQFFSYRTLFSMASNSTCR